MADGSEIQSILALEQRIAAYRLDPTAPDLARQVYDRLNRAIAREEALANIVNHFEEPTHGGDGIGPPDHSLGPHLGTTVGDSGPALGREPTEDDRGDLKQELSDRLWAMANGSGLRVGTGEAAGKPGDSAADEARKMGEDSRQQMEQQLKDLQSQAERLQLLALLAAALDRAAKAEARAAAAEAKLKAKAARDKAKQPNPDTVEGGHAPSHPLHDPYAESLRRPHLPDPLDDPRTQPEGGEGSLIPVAHGQATDPNPGADDQAGGGHRAVLTTSQGVTDPPRDPALSSARRQAGLATWLAWLATSLIVAAGLAALWARAPELLERGF